MTKILRCGAPYPANSVKAELARHALPELPVSTNTARISHILTGDTVPEGNVV